MTADRKVSRIDVPDTAVSELPALALRRAEAAAESGDLAGALRLAEQVIGDPAGPERARAIEIAGAALASCGRWGRSAELFAHLDDSGDAAAARLLSVVGLVAAGDVARATVAAEARVRLPRPPPLRDEAIALMATGLLQTMGAEGPTGLRTLLESAELLEAAGEPSLLPDTPHALGAIVAMQLNDFEVAEHLLSRAALMEPGGKAVAGRHQVLRAFVAMRAGRWRAADARLRVARRGRQLGVRDALVASAVEIGVARRTGAMERLAEAWPRAFDAMLRHPVDLYAVQSFGELILGGVRLGRLERVRPWIEEMDGVLARAGKPSLWTLISRWDAVQAAILSEHTEELERAVAELSAIPASIPRLSGLELAGRTWLQVLRGEIRMESIDEGVQALIRAGLAWEAARLAGQAAVRSGDREVTRVLLERARHLRNAPDDGDDEEHHEAALTDREREVGVGVLAGLTYKAIGERLFISPRTVEHHVAKIRQRLGAATRAEFLAALRKYLGK